VALVVACHFGLHSNGGFVGVDVFFVLSGFLITSLLIDEREKTGRISFRQFWARRALRLFPALGCAIVFALLLSLDASASVRHFTVIAVPAVLLYVGNWWMALGHGHSLGLLGACWSLAIEEQFYVLWPVLAVLWMARTEHRRRAAAIVGALSVADCAWSILAQHSLRISSVYFRTDTHAMGLLAGSALALFLSEKRVVTLSRRATICFQAAAILAVLLILAITVSVRYNNAGTVDQLAVIVATGASAVIVTQLILVPMGILTRCLEHPIAKWIGRRSYGIYLFNYPISVILLQHNRRHGLHRLELTVLGVIAIVLIAGASYRWVEQPFLKRKVRFTPA
jgi:peptidoglycan/LPS O-acetylase OafA/YrhL